MASAAYNPELTLAPFYHIYGNLRELMLLADDNFPTPRARSFSPPDEEPEAAVPQIITLPDRSRFEAAVAQWLDDTEFDSLPDAMKDHDSFREIVKDGPSVVPLIAAHLRRTPSFLFLALEELFGEDPVPEESYGNLQTTVSAWLRWLQR